MLRRNFIAILLAGVLAVIAPFAGAQDYYPPAIGDFDGAADYLSRGSDLAGNADGKLGTVSVWYRVDGGAGNYRHIFHNDSSYFYLRVENSNIWGIYLQQEGGGVVLGMTSSSSVPVENTWHHFMASWDLANNKSYLYVDGVNRRNANTVVDVDGDYTRTSWAVGAQAISSWAHGWDGAISEFYLNTAEHIDLSSAANRRLFIDANGRPVYLGADGSLPTGTAPIIYMHERWNNCGINSGTGGDFTINGAPAYTDGPAGAFFPLTTAIPARGMGSRMRIH